MRCLTRWACVKGERPWWHLVVQVNIVATLKLVFFSEHLLGNIIIRVQRIFTRNNSRRIHFYSIPCITRRNFRRIFMKDLLSAKDKDKAVKSMYSVLLLSSSSIKMWIELAQHLPQVPSEQRRLGTERSSLKFFLGELIFPTS